MDVLILRAVVTNLNERFAGGVLEEVRAEPPDRLRFVLQARERRASFVAGLDPRSPWLGRIGAKRGRIAGPGQLMRCAGRIKDELHGRILLAVEQVGALRLVRLPWSGGSTTWIELTPSRPNVLLVDPDGRIVAAARRPASERGRVEPGEPYRRPPVPETRLPLTAAASELDEAVRADRSERGGGVAEALRRIALGLGRSSSEALAARAAATGEGPGSLAREAFEDAGAGRLRPAIEAERDPRAMLEDGVGDPQAIALTAGLAPGHRLHAAQDAPHTVGLCHELLYVLRGAASRGRGLRVILDRRLARLENARERALADLGSFDDPDTHRRAGEALLAGASCARREGDALIVPDPYRAGSELRVPAASGETPAAAADAEFRRSRRAERGRRAAAERIARLESAMQRLAELSAASADAEGIEALDRLEARMRAEGIAVGLEQQRVKQQLPGIPARLEGVRLYISPDGFEVLVGKGARQNDRLSFKLAGPEDFWLHVRDVPGAHVVVRNPERLAELPEATLRCAAAAAAWFSDARSQPAVDVHWTRRKYVRRQRGTPPGTVRVKRSKTVRVAPAVPPDPLTAPPVRG